MSWIGNFFGMKTNIKRVYFVRHGETVLNVQKIRQGSEGGLTEKGKKQAEETGERLAKFPIDVMLASPFERTRETADIINSFLHKKIEYPDLLVERRNPSEIVGKWAGDPAVRPIIDLIDKSFHDADFRFSDEENFADLKVRAKKLLAYLETRPEKNILCVTHGNFLAMVMAYVAEGDALAPETFAKLSFFDPAKNAGISVCECSSRLRKTPVKHWQVLAWNDYSRHK